MEMKVVVFENTKMLIFPTGRIYKCVGDSIQECKPKIEVIIDKKTFKVYKHAYIHFAFSRYSIPQLVAKAFVPNPNEYKKIKRKDGDVLNNRAENLQWVSNNCQHKTISKGAFAEVEYDKLGEWNQAAYDFIIDDNESKLYHICFIGSLKGYLRKALLDNGAPFEKLEDHLDRGYELLRKRLKAYYLPMPGRLGENRLRKFFYFCFVFTSSEEMGEMFIPRQLRKKMDSEEIFDYYYND